jgi:hypothetical protein
MTISNVFVGSEKGTKAAWKGFSSQTLYIAHRLMFLDDHSDFFPEKVEDLLVVRDNIPTEAVQVKNYSSELKLSDFSPRKPDSFFRRALSLRQENNTLKILIISFGPLGKELEKLGQGDENIKKKITARLLTYEYSQGDVDWLLENLEIQVVNQTYLEEQIYTDLTQKTETMAAPRLALAVLTHYVSVLSQKGGKTSKKEWNQKLHNIASDLVAMSGFHQEYGRSLRPLFEYKTNLPSEKITEQYRMGINARPDHIRHNLDFKRETWLQEIEHNFIGNQVVIIRGASGQGKTSLAYRYLIDTYPESNVICIEQVETSSQAANIVAAMSNLSISKEDDLIAYIDVQPYQTGWIWVLQQLQKTGRTIKLLVTIREEDYRRTVVDKSSISMEEIELLFDKEEAQAIYPRYSLSKFRNFDEAWDKFGGKGPLMEFVYLINAGQTLTLRQKLSAQIEQIRMNEADTQSWLEFLRLSTYAGRHNLNLNLRKAIKVTQCKNYEKMIHLFEKEYLLRETDDKTYIEPLHAIRAEIIYSILEDPGLYPEDELMIQAIQCVDNFSQTLVVNHCYENEFPHDLVKKIAAISFDKWANYASALRGILWVEVYRLFRVNKEIVLLGDSHLNNSFGFLALADITGLLGEYNPEEILDVMRTINPQGLTVFRDIFAKIPQKHLQYDFVDIFIGNHERNMPQGIPEDSAEASNLGFILFWLSIRNIFIDKFFADGKFIPVLNAIDPDAALDLIEGVYHQKWTSLYSKAVNALSPRVYSKWRIISFEEDENKVSSHFIADVFTDHAGKHLSAHSQNMAVVNALRKLYPGKDKYATKILGADFMEGIPVPDQEKNVDAQYLKNEWVTQLNGWYRNLNTYEHRANTWGEYVDEIIQIRNSAADAAQAIAKGLDFLYKKSGNLKKLTSTEVTDLLSKTHQQLSGDKSILPKSVVDQFGFVGDTVKEDSNQQKQKEKNAQEVLRGSVQAILTKKIRDAFRKYCSSFAAFLNQKNDLIASRTKGTPAPQNIHLPLINLLETISQIKVMQREFRKLFEELIDEEKIEDLEKREMENMELLLEMWKFLEETNLQKLDSVAYTRKKKITQRKQKIEGFFTQKLLAIDGVSNISKPTPRVDGEFNIYVTVDIHYTELFFKSLFDKFKRTFPNAATYTIDELYIRSFVDNIIVIPALNNFPMMGAIEVETRNLIIFDEERIRRYETPYEPDEYMKNNFTLLPKDALVSRWGILLGLINAINLMLAHSYKTNETIASFDQKTIIKDVYLEWTHDGVASLSEILDLFSVELQGLFNQLDKKDDAKTLLNSIKQKTNLLATKKEALMQSAERQLVSELLGGVETDLEHLFAHIVKV